jgi:hypothetical protein
MRAREGERRAARAREAEGREHAAACNGLPAATAARAHARTHARAHTRAHARRGTGGSDPGAADLNGAAEIEDRVLERKRDGRAVHGAAARGRHGFEAGRDHQRVPAVLTY